MKRLWLWVVLWVFVWFAVTVMLVAMHKAWEAEQNNWYRTYESQANLHNEFLTQPPPEWER